jgi:hypothetical protein
VGRWGGVGVGLGVEVGVPPPVAVEVFVKQPLNRRSAIPKTTLPGHVFLCVSVHL